MVIVTRDFDGERNYFKIYKVHCSGNQTFEHHRWTMNRSKATRFVNFRDALNRVAMHVPERNQHKCEVATCDF